MTKWPTLTPKNKRRVTRDWNDRFPSLHVDAPMSLLRRVGPLAVGVILDRRLRGVAYEPAAFAHVLLGPQSTPRFRAIGLGGYVRQPGGGQYTIHLYRHEDLHARAAGWLREQAYVPIEGPVSLADVVNGYRRFVADHPYESHTPVRESMAMLCHWLGASDHFEFVLEDTRRAMDSWRPSLIERLGGRESYLAGMRERATDTDRLNAALAENVAAQKLDRFPVEELAPDA